MLLFVHIFQENEAAPALPPHNVRAFFVFEAHFRAICSRLPLLVSIVVANMRLLEICNRQVCLNRDVCMLMQMCV